MLKNKLNMFKREILVCFVFVGLNINATQSNYKGLVRVGYKNIS